MLEWRMEPLLRLAFGSMAFAIISVVINLLIYIAPPIEQRVGHEGL
jgi:hypothetical protein